MYAFAASINKHRPILGMSRIYWDIGKGKCSFFKDYMSVYRLKLLIPHHCVLSNKPGKHIPELFQISNVMTSPNVMKLVKARVVVQIQKDPGLLLIPHAFLRKKPQELKWWESQEAFRSSFPAHGRVAMMRAALGQTLLGFLTFLKPILVFPAGSWKTHRHKTGEIHAEESTLLKGQPKAPEVQKAYLSQHSFCPHPKPHTTLWVIKPLLLYSSYHFTVPLNCNWSRIRPLYPDTELNLRDRVLGEVEKYSSIALPGEGGHSGLMPSRLCVLTCRR